MEIEEDQQIRRDAFKITAHIKCEGSHREQKHDNKNEGERCRKITAKLAAEDGC